MIKLSIKEDFSTNNIIYLNTKNYCIQSHPASIKIECNNQATVNAILDDYNSIASSIDNRLNTKQKQEIRKQRVAVLLFEYYNYNLIEHSEQLDKFLHDNIVYLPNRTYYNDYLPTTIDSGEPINVDTELPDDDWANNKDI